MFGFHRTGVTATASTQSGICTDVSGDTWLDESRRTDAAATTRKCDHCEKSGRNVRKCKHCARDKRIRKWSATKMASEEMDTKVQ